MIINDIYFITFSFATIMDAIKCKMKLDGMMDAFFCTTRHIVSYCNTIILVLVFYGKTDACMINQQSNVHIFSSSFENFFVRYQMVSIQFLYV
jgi:hypothetical protein